MLNSNKLLSHSEQVLNGEAGSASSELLEYGVVLDQCWNYITEKTANSGTVNNAAEAQKMQHAVLRFLREFVEEKKPRVARPGMSEDGKQLIYRFDELMTKLEEDITQHGVITSAYVDPNVSEIQINDYQTIWVERNGNLEILTDEVTGERVTFKSVEDCYSTIYRLLRSSKANFTRHDTIAKGRTIEGYRVAAVHQAATAGEKGAYQNREPSPSCVIRKFPESNFTTKDMVAFGSMSTELANVLTILPKSDVTVLVVGPTGSGKTVLVQLVLNHVPSDMRIYAIENPSELGIKKYNSKGQVINNVVQYESLADETPEDKLRASRHTAIGLMMQALRMTPHYFVFGEVRFNDEINQAMVAANTGHKFVTTFHAGDDYGAIRRVVNAVIATNEGIPMSIVMDDVCSNVDFIFCQEKQWDKSRKVMHLTEVKGTVMDQRKGSLMPDLTRVFEFVAERKQPGDKKMRGAHYQKAEFSDAMKDRMMRSRLDIMEYDLITRPLDKDENGNVIPRRGIYDTDLLIRDEEVEKQGVVQAMLNLCARYVGKGYECPINLDNYDLTQEQKDFVYRGLIDDSESDESIDVDDLLGGMRNKMRTGTSVPSNGLKGISDKPRPELKPLQKPVAKSSSSRLFNGEARQIGIGSNDYQTTIASAVLDVEQAMEEMGMDSANIDLNDLYNLAMDEKPNLRKSFTEGGDK